MKTCPNCQSPNLDVANFCCKCGSSLSKPVSGNAQVESKQLIPANAPKSTDPVSVEFKYTGKEQTSRTISSLKEALAILQEATAENPPFFNIVYTNGSKAWLQLYFEGSFAVGCGLSSAETRTAEIGKFDAQLAQRMIEDFFAGNADYGYVGKWETLDLSTSQSTNAPSETAPKQHLDPVCPHCGSTDCQPVTRLVTTTKSKGFSLSNGCCGMCLLGPVGLLCGLCGTGSKSSTDSELFWVCKSCGKEHLSQKDGFEKLKVMSASFALGTVLVALLLSVWHTAGSLHWLFMVAYAIVAPILVIVALDDDELTEKLGYSPSDLIPEDKLIPDLLILIGAIIAALIFGGPIISNLLEL